MTQRKLNAAPRRDVVAQEPSANNGHRTVPQTAATAAAVECRACGHTGAPVGRGQCARCKAFLLGNVAGMKHGGRREHPLADPEDSDLFREWASDLGGELTAGRRIILRRVVEADAVCQSALDYILRSRESLTSSRVQKALAVLASHSSTVYRGAALLDRRCCCD